MRLGWWPALGWVSLIPYLCTGATYTPTTITTPKPQREFRAAWIATVGNIDWPSAQNLSVRQQRVELIQLLDFAAQLRLNAVIFQVRPACDALYPSTLEPWSEYLTGAMGKAPEPFWDPLAFAVEEAHKRGLELHAWFNPYRARHVQAKSPISADHVSKRRPHLVRRYGNGLWLDPGEKEVQDYSLAVVMDVVRRYDIDGVHFDDYFYPYPEKDARGRVMPFPDDASWTKYGAGKGLSRADWRRENVNTFVQRAHQSVRAAKPWVKFGISPFGIWRPGDPPQIRGKDAYEEIYADARKWLQAGWVDYLAPQLYWQIDPPAQSFPVLHQWWLSQNSRNRYLWPGLNSVKVNEGWPPSEIVRQIKITRTQPHSNGHIHWNLRRGLMATNGLSAALQRELYTSPALVPAFPWKGNSKLTAPQTSAVRVKNDLTISWKNTQPRDISRWILETRTHGRWTTRYLPRAQTRLVVSGPPPEVIALTPVDRYGNLGLASALQLKK
jgi:uncharacterized lipoprotein YddW (UPF0748 family)